MRARPPPAPAQGPMLASARRRALKATAVYGALPVFGRNVGRAISPAAGPCGIAVRCGARRCRTLRGISATKRQCTPQSAPSGASSSPCRGAFLCAAASKASPARGGVAAGDGGVPHLALQISFRVAASSRPPYTLQNTGKDPSRPPHSPGCRPPLRRGRCLHRPAVRALKIAAIYGLLPAFGRNVGRAISPAAWALWIHRLCGMAFCISRPCPRRRTPPRRA